MELRDLQRVYALPGSTVRQAKLEKFYADQLQLLEKISFDAISQPGKVDYLLLRSRLEREQRQIIAEGQREPAIAALIPFRQTIIGFEEARRRMDTVDGQKSALALEKLVREIAAAKDSLSGVKKDPAALNGAAQRLEQLRGTLRTWYDFYALYDPKFVWWVETSYKKSDEAVEAHAQFLHTTSGIAGTLQGPAAEAEGEAGVAEDVAAAAAAVVMEAEMRRLPRRAEEAVSRHRARDRSPGKRRGTFRRWAGGSRCADRCAASGDDRLHAG